ncbi:hypothetical protein A6A11_03580 [Bisgaardia hudsonensis]|nr:hypothetical protein A6A11_03580 [Bisgaardia hudsonensis]
MVKKIVFFDDFIFSTLKFHQLISFSFSILIHYDTLISVLNIQNFLLFDEFDMFKIGCFDN